MQNCFNIYNPKTNLLFYLIDKMLSLKQQILNWKPSIWRKQNIKEGMSWVVNGHIYIILFSHETQHIKRTGKQWQLGYHVNTQWHMATRLDWKRIRILYLINISIVLNRHIQLIRTLDKSFDLIMGTSWLYLFPSFLISNFIWNTE